MFFSLRSIVLRRAQLRADLLNRILLATHFENCARNVVGQAVDQRLGLKLGEEDLLNRRLRRRELLKVDVSPVGLRGGIPVRIGIKPPVIAGPGRLGLSCLSARISWQRGIA